METVKVEKSYTTLLDEDLIPYVHRGDEKATEYILNKYEHIVRKKASGYFLVGSDRDDVVQEGRIGLFKAISDYDASKKSSFRSFAELCITRQIITSIKNTTRLKHLPLNSYVSLYKPVHEDEEARMLLETIHSHDDSDPLERLIDEERYNHIQNEIMKALTRLEWDVLHLYLHGFSYEEIAEKLNRQEKSIDNALQRVRRKIEKLIDEDVFSSL